MTGDLFTRVIEAIDQANTADPETVEDGGETRPAALVYGQRMSAELIRFAPQASEPLRVAVRGQHIERWKMPRASYPEGRQGYLEWRRDLGRYHAQRVAEIMAAVGYPQADCERTAQIVRKEGIKRDPDVQTLEDVACLVFMRWYFAGFAEGRDRDHVRHIVGRTARKMSAAGRADALEQFDLPSDLVPVLAD
ncbi:MAG: DUF4202 domain-containing protein [Paracoccaceae bacterium]|nr:DUF4202 domain-containing protein [Paracoccaceae bacterium]